MSPNVSSPWWVCPSSFDPRCGGWRPFAGRSGEQRSLRPRVADSRPTAKTRRPTGLARAVLRRSARDRRLRVGVRHLLRLASSSSNSWIFVAAREVVFRVEFLERFLLDGLNVVVERHQADVRPSFFVLNGREPNFVVGVARLAVGLWTTAGPPICDENTELPSFASVAIGLSASTSARLTPLTRQAAKYIVGLVAR